VERRWRLMSLSREYIWTWCCTICSEVWYHVFLAEQSHVEWCLAVTWLQGWCCEYVLDWWEIIPNVPLNIFGHSNLKMTATWCWTLCSKVWYWFHVFLAEQSMLNGFFEQIPCWLSLIFSFLCNFSMNFSFLSQPQELKYK